MTPHSLGRISLLLFFIAFSASARQDAPGFPVAGTLAGQQVATTVDSELGTYYLEHYLRGNRTKGAYDKTIDAAFKEVNADPYDRESLRQLSQRFSTDFATIHFVARLYAMPANRRAQDAFHALLEKPKTAAPNPAMRTPEPSKSYLFAFVPGYAYKKDRTTGADFARQRQIMARAGFQTLLVETDELGTVEENAAILAKEIVRLGQEHHKVILVSGSKGGPEVALVLGERLPPEALSHVRAWVSVGGILQGSPYADQWLRWPRRWFAQVVFAFQGLRPKVIRNLSTEVRRGVFARLNFPPHILKLQYVGVPLSGHIGKSTSGRYGALRPLGPNDGLTLLADELVPGGIVVTDIGLDHYYSDPIIELKTLALAHVVLEELEREQAEPQTAGSAKIVTSYPTDAASGRLRHACGSGDANASSCD